MEYIKHTKPEVGNHIAAPMMPYTISDTKFEATWVNSSISPGHIWSCSNCHHTIHVDDVTELSQFCSCCGFRVSNTQQLKVLSRYEYED